MKAKQIAVVDHKPFMLVNKTMVICNGKYTAGAMYVKTEDKEFLQDVKTDKIGYTNLEGIELITNTSNCGRPSPDEIANSLSESDVFMLQAEHLGLIETSVQDMVITEIGPCKAIVLDDEIIIDTPAGITRFKRDSEGIKNALDKWGGVNISTWRAVTDGMPSGLADILISAISHPS